MENCACVFHCGEGMIYIGSEFFGGLFGLYEFLAPE